MNKNTIFNYPNCIGYFRIILLSFCIFNDRMIFCVLYTISALLDAVDGKVARRYNQCSFLGSCLDMITDRVSTILIIIKITGNISHNAQFVTKSDYINNFLCYVLLIDILSHFMYFSYAITLKTHHKTPQNTLLGIYYRKNVLLVLCTSVELFYISLYMATFYSSIFIAASLLLPFCMAKFFFHVVQLYVAICGLSMHELKLKE